jgi:hypothetical protein
MSVEYGKSWRANALGSDGAVLNEAPKFVVVEHLLPSRLSRVMTIYYLT